MGNQTGSPREVDGSRPVSVNRLNDHLASIDDEMTMDELHRVRPFGENYTLQEERRMLPPVSVAQLGGHLHSIDHDDEDEIVIDELHRASLFATSLVPVEVRVEYDGSVTL